jgi:hypothetical protein
MIMGETIQMRFSLKIGGAFLSEEAVHARARETRAPLDQGPLLGALHVTCKGVDVLGEAECDEIVDLFSYIVNGIDAIFRGEPFSTYFPDMPIQLTIVTRHDLVFISVGKRRAAAPRGEFLRELYDVCRRFFELMLVLFPSGWDEPYLKKVKALRDQYPEFLADRGLLKARAEFMPALGAQLGMPTFAREQGIDAYLPYLERMQHEGCHVLLKIDGPRPGKNQFTAVVSGGHLGAGEGIRMDARELTEAAAFIVVEYARNYWSFAQ